MEGVQLGGDLRIREIGQGLGASVIAVGTHDHHQVAVVVGVGEVNGDLALGGGGHARDHGVDHFAVQGGDQAVPLNLHHDQLLVQGLGDALGDLHVVAAGIAHAAVDGHAVLVSLDLGPVEGGIVALHAHAELALGEGAGGKQHGDGQQGDDDSLH